MSVARYLVGDVFDVMATLPDSSVDLVLTSPPFLALRSYLPADHPDKAKEIGSEPTPAEFLDTLLALTAEWGRLLGPYGSLCVELGDTYASTGGQTEDDGRTGWLSGGRTAAPRQARGGGRPGWPLDKSLCGIPHLYHLSLAYGRNLLTGEPSPAGQWRVRNVVAWCLDIDTVVYVRTPTGDRPMRLLHLDQQFQPGKFELWDGDRWTRVLGTSQSRADDALELEFRNGERVSCTRNHEWPVDRAGIRKVVRADELTVGDVVPSVRLPDSGRPEPVHAPDDDIGWLCGVFLADGSFDSKGRIQVSGHSVNDVDRSSRLRRIAADYGGTSGTYDHEGMSSTTVLRSTALSGMIRQYVAGDNARNKRLGSLTWNRSDGFLRSLLDGYLQSDAHYDAKNDRWRLGFTDNPWLARDLRTIGARVGAVVRVKRARKVQDSAHSVQGQPFHYRGEVRFADPKPGRWGQPGVRSEPGEIVAIRSSKRRSFIDVGVEGEPHLFALASGLLTHNCRPNPPVGALGDKFRPGTSYMTIATRARDRWFDLDAVRFPNSDMKAGGSANSRQASGDVRGQGENSRRAAKSPQPNPAGAPPLDWWEVSTEPYSGSHYACVDADTEALTRDGWKRHDHLTDGDEIAAYDATRGVIEWQRADFHRYPFDGELVAIDQRETVQRLTPNHRVIHKTGRGNIATRRADEAVPSWRIPVAASFAIHDPDGPGVELAALLGWFITEGAITSRNVVRIYQSETANPKHCNAIRDLLDAVNADYSERRRVRPIGASLSPRESVEVSWAIRGEVARWLMETAPDKRLTAAPLGWYDDECEALLDALIAGDGHTRSSGRRQFVQKDRTTIDAFQALCCRLGLRSTISPRLGGDYSLTIGERSWVSLRGTNGESRPIGREHYSGIVWCPSVPATYWLARRNGRPFITGNTWPRKLLDRPIKAMCPMQVCVECGEPRRRIVDVQGLHGKDILAIDTENERGTGLQGKRPPMPDITRETVGWSDCGHGNYRNGIVLDPFAGSGTTLAVATGHGRDAIGIDLDERNADLACERIGMFLDVTDTRATTTTP